ncbi:hypothetical protein BDB00DRAFT_878354 [Zychaea mexicana]|uniref:uncharacterized protein n=1 Tax=Zychaea mexicana TaxID=64656 RepID=UPI0022FE7D39|nr:uncharacterized protein BDB00DRAFT_878354 [Zychaea mexicana]KAI9484865.1 hypothetical protein BDB00DRAFT_878354 [Zychaea mexicana]
MSPHDHLSSFDASFSDSFSEDLIRQFDHKTKAIRNALNEEEPPSAPLPQPKQEQHDHTSSLAETEKNSESVASSPTPSSQAVIDAATQEQDVPSSSAHGDSRQQQEVQQAEESQMQQQQQQQHQQNEQEEKERSGPKLTVVVPERELRPSRSRFFRSPKKMKSLSRLFTTAKEQDEQQQQESLALPKAISPWSATTPTSVTQSSSPSSTIFGNICHYPPKPLQYSTDISPPADTNGCSTDEFALKSRRSCTLKPVTPEPSEQRRSSAPALPPRSYSKHHRMFAFLWSSK